VRDRDKSEVDFLILRGTQPLLLVEAKLAETEPAPALVKMRRALGVPAVQLVNIPGISRKAAGKGEGILVASADRWLRGCPDMKLLLVAGARPNFMKIAPIVRALAAARAGGAADLSWKLVHTGQHYDHGMSQVFFEELEIPEPDFDLGCGSGSHAAQIHFVGNVMINTLLCQEVRACAFVTSACKSPRSMPASGGPHAGGARSGALRRLRVVRIAAYVCTHVTSMESD